MGIIKLEEPVDGERVKDWTELNNDVVSHLDEFKQLISTVDPSVDIKDKVCQEVNDYKNLHWIFAKLWKPDGKWGHVAPRGSFVDLVFRMILLHQSILGCQHFAPLIELTGEEKFAFCDPLLFSYMVIFMKV